MANGSAEDREESEDVDMNGKRRRKRTAATKRVTSRTPVNSLVRFDFDNVDAEYHSCYPFTRTDVLLFMGEIRQMVGHCVVATKDGRVIWGYHTENFVVLSEDEL